jgi:thiol-disulfide isomerase/thioredoxin
MKKHFLFLICLLGSWSVFAQKGFILRVKLNNPQQYPIHLLYTVKGKSLTDTSSTFENGALVFKGTVDEPVVAIITSYKTPALFIQTEKVSMPGPALYLVLTNDEINVEGEVDKLYMAKVKGGRPNNEWSQIREEEGKIANESWLLKKHLYENNIADKDSSLFRASKQKMVDLSQKSEALKKKFVEDNPNSFVSLYFLNNKVSTLSFEDLKIAYAKLGDDYKTTTTIGQNIAKKIESLEATDVGKMAVPISKKDINGNMVNLQSLRGKYVLLDFWGSWCVPCRKSHPHLKELYAKYKEQGFEILGIAQEVYQDQNKNREAWKKAIEKDGLSWMQVFNNEDIEKFDAVKAYGISSFPTKILLDKEGKIIARFVGDDGLGGGLLDEKLKEIFGN